MAYSVILITYNDERTISKCLDSIDICLNQDDEIIVLDNGSRDRTCSIVENFYSRKATKKFITSEVNLGISLGRNTAAKMAKGNILVFIDSDMLVKKNSLKEVTKEMICSDAVVGVYENVGEGFVWYRDLKYKALSGKKNEQSFRKKISMGGGFITLSGGFFAVKRNVFNELGGFKESFNEGGSEDIDFELRLLNKGYKVNCIGSFQGEHRKAKMTLSDFFLWGWKTGIGNSNLLKESIKEKYYYPVKPYGNYIPISPFIYLLIFSIIKFYPALLICFILFGLQSIPFLRVRDYGYRKKLFGSLLFTLNEFITCVSFSIYLLRIIIRKIKYLCRLVILNKLTEGEKND